MAAASICGTDYRLLLGRVGAGRHASAHRPRSRARRTCGRHGRRGDTRPRGRPRGRREPRRRLDLLGLPPRRPAPVPQPPRHRRAHGWRVRRIRRDSAGKCDREQWPRTRGRGPPGADGQCRARGSSSSRSRQERTGDRLWPDRAVRGRHRPRRRRIGRHRHRHRAVPPRAGAHDAAPPSRSTPASPRPRARSARPRTARGWRWSWR